VLPAAAAAALSGLVGAIGADSRWLAALGRTIVHTASIPDRVPYASANTHGWANVPALAEVAFYGLNWAFGNRGLAAAQLVAVGAAFLLLTFDMRAAGTSPASWLPMGLLVWLGSFGAWVVVRVQLFSLILFALLVVLLRAETRRPSLRIWLLVPLVALWSNLHGAVLIGLAVAWAYLLFERLRRDATTAAGVGVAATAALFATPVLWRTGDYYRGVLENEAARRGVGLWGRLSFHSGVDLLLLATGLVLLTLALFARPRLWELVALAGLAFLTVRAARTGVWFLFLAATPAARAIPFRLRPGRPLAPPFVAAAAIGVVAALIRGPLVTGASTHLLHRALADADSTPVLAEDQLAEQVALRGGRIWVGNPIDAFHRRDQRTYIDWLEGDPAGDGALRHAPRVVLARRDGDAARRLAHNHRFRRVAEDAHAVLFERAH
jgi:hypothetical protein